ncbi:MAG: 50S ribosomal protein L25 [Opitutales bacterium]
MQTYSLDIVNRENTGRGVARRLRAEGKIPASLYGQGKARSVTVSAVAFRDLNREIGGGAALVELKDEKGDSALCLIQDVQHHAIKGTVDHIDFQEVERGHTFTTKIPTVLVGEADCAGVKEGGILDHKSLEVEIRCRPSKLPENVEVDVSALEVGSAVHISDLPVLDEVEYLGEPAQVIVSVQAPTVAAEPEVEASEEVAADEVPATKVSDDAGDSAEEATSEEK